MAQVELKRVGIVSPGDMGAGIGKVLHQHGLEAVCCLEGRSELTRLRAHEAGFVEAPSLDALVGGVDMLLCVLVPSEAVPMAEAVAGAMQRTGARPVYADLNAIAPQTSRRIEQIIAAAGAPYIDAGIIGGPPGPRGGTTFHCSGPDTAAFEALAGYGLAVNVVGTEIGQASGLKMVYAASTKGTTALWTELLTAARAMGLSEALKLELGDGVVAQNAYRSIPGMPNRARRWVGEMEEIAATFEALGMTPHILQGAAEMYRLVGETPFADLTSRDPNPELDTLLQGLVERLRG